MSLFGKFVGEVVNGFASAAFNHSRNNQAARLIESCCNQNGWAIDERTASGAIVLHFNDAITRIRKILITCDDQGQIALFSAYSASQIPARQVPADLMAFLLNRNRDIALPAWQLSVDEGIVTFSACYCALVQGIEPMMFKYICQQTVKEVCDFDAKLRQAGLL